MATHIDAFSRFLASRWVGDFPHRYEITKHGAWLAWRQSPYCSDPLIWFCSSLKDACDHYSWPGGEQFPSLSERLRDAINAGDNKSAAAICVEIFAWGGVGRDRNGAPDRSRAWVDEARQNGSLCEKLKTACVSLCDEQSSLETFDGVRFLMNSAMTKVYAAVDPDQLIIYDGRVGAALGLLARDYLYEANVSGCVPDELAFGWGASRTRLSEGVKSERDPGDDHYRFPRIFGSRKDRRHAQMMRDASCLLRRVVSSFEGNSGPTLGELERALFMVGYDVSRRL